MSFDILMEVSKAMDGIADTLFKKGHYEAALIASEKALDYCNRALEEEHINIEHIIETGRHMWLAVDNTKKVLN